MAYDLDKFLEIKKKLEETLDKSELVTLLAQKLAEDEDKGDKIIIDQPYTPYVPYAPYPDTGHPWTSPFVWTTTCYTYSDDSVVNEEDKADE